MCGICGTVQHREPGLLERMLAVIHHRGPDDVGTYQDDIAAIGMRRLSIIDLEGGHQPITNESGDIHVVFNGEIYNYRELRRDLLKRGHRFATESDTEVIVHLYEEKGPEFLNDLNGMFAIAIWDTRKRSLLLARDRLGIKPLLYSRVGDGLIFASELKALLQSTAIPRELDPKALNEYLAFLYVPSPRTMIRRIEKLPPAHYLKWHDGNISIERYWKLESKQTTRQTDDEYIQQLREMLEQAVRRHMIADVPVGAMLSGGLDSSIIVALMSRMTDEPVRTFSIGYGGGAHRFNETEYARRVAKQFGTQHQELETTGVTADSLREMVWHLDEPAGNSSYLPTFLISQAAAKEVKVLLSGAGGDELLGGYPRYQGAVWAEAMSRVPSGLVRLGAAVARRIPQSSNGRHWPRRAVEFLEGCQLSPERRAVQWTTFLNATQRMQLLSDDVRSTLERHDPEAEAAALIVGDKSTSPGDQAMLLDLERWLPGNILEYTDKMTMMASIEGRVPFLDAELVEFALSVPFDLKVRARCLKWLLKKVGEDWLPRDVVYRPKKGFMVPVGHWMKHDLRELVNDSLSSETMQRRGLFDPDAIDHLLTTHHSGRRDLTHQIWSLLTLELWFEMYLDGSPEKHGLSISQIHSSTNKECAR